MGTGYFLTANVLATANHVLAGAGLTQAEVRTEADGTWRTAQLPPLWCDPVLDVAFIRVTDGLDDVADLKWVEEPFAEDVAWYSNGYPVAAQVRQEGRPPLVKTAGMRGTLYAGGGGGQGIPELELTVDAPPPAESWAGISGAPIFVADRLAGFIKEVPVGFNGGRLAGTPAASILKSHGFRLALAEPWQDSESDRPWILVVSAETRTDLAEWVTGMFESQSHRGALEVALGSQVERIREVKIVDALRSPGDWLQFVRVLCRAPIAIFDATTFEPAVMVALGVRAVVRRGITITSTADPLSPSTLSTLPFNIQESKLVHHGSSYPLSDARHPYNMLAAAIRKGWQDMRSGPRYLDLPAYDAVRCPFPGISKDDPSAVDRILILCSFRAEYEDNWLYLSNALALHFGTSRPPVRMLDIASPRLVGQALYESIRWARTCVVDWTGWRPNVFFELGVRLACAEIGPVNVIDHRATAAVNNAASPRQYQLLLNLFGVAPYDIKHNSTIRATFRSHDAIVRQQSTRTSLDTIPHDATYNLCVDCFDSRHERITANPHEMLRRSVQEPFGPDRQALGRSPILYSNNAGFSKDLERSIRERWIAAWYYLYHRHSKERWSEDAQLRAEMRKLGNEVLQFALRGSDDPRLIELRNSIFEILDELENLDDA